MLRLFLLLCTLPMLLPIHAQAAADKPNILVIWGDDIGYWNVSDNNRGMIGYKTPNIDRIANEGLSFTDYYGEQSCTAGRSAFITGQAPVRTGLTKVGMPGAPQRLHEKDPTIAELLKPLGYATGQFGKNHLGDLNKFFPTVHGFDVWKNPFTPQGWPSLVNLRADPFERAMHESIGWGVWSTRRMFAISAAALVATDFMKTFLDYPQRQQPGSFNTDQIMKQLEAVRAAGQ